MKNMMMVAVVVAVPVMFQSDTFALSHTLKCVLSEILLAPHAARSIPKDVLIGAC